MAAAAHSLVLYGSQQFTVIPTRVFQEARQRETFERLVTWNVPKVIDQTNGPRQSPLARGLKF